jgi:hypothetical protein
MACIGAAWAKARVNATAVVFSKVLAVMSTPRLMQKRKQPQHNNGI